MTITLYTTWDFQVYVGTSLKPQTVKICDVIMFEYLLKTDNDA